MEIDAVLEALKDFDSKGTKETCPCLEQLLCHIAKTGETMIPWPQFKPYFLFKMEMVIDDFHEFTPEQRALANPNVEYIPFEDMKNRILKIVDGYNGIPFTIQRLCELLMDPKRNYSGADKFIRGVEKNIMVVSCVYPTLEKNGTSVNRMNGVMFTGNSSIYSDSGNPNGQGTPKPLHRPKLLLTPSLSTNGIPGKVPNKVSTAVVVETNTFSDTSPSEGESTQSCRIKNKHEEAEVSEGDPHEAKRLKCDEGTNGEKTLELSCLKASESLSESQESSEVTCEAENKGPSSNKSIISETQDPSSAHTTPYETEEKSSGKEAELTVAPSENTAISVGSPDEFPQSGKSLNLEVQHSGNENSTPSDKSVPTSPSSVTDFSTEGAAGYTETPSEPNEDHD